MASIYATVADVQARVPFRTIGATTIPSTAQVQQWLDDAEAALSGTLRAAELSPPYVTTEAVSILRRWVAEYVAGLVLQAWASANVNGDNTAGQTAIDRFNFLLDDIVRYPGKYGAMLHGGSAPVATSQLRSYTLNNSDGKTIFDGDFEPRTTKDEVF